jgi:hypothetical protein
MDPGVTAIRPRFDQGVAAFAKSLSLGASSEEPRLKNECDLLIVGLGPIGDVCAGLAALEGLHVIAIDRDTAPYPLPRAAVFDDEIMRIFQRVGVAERLEDICWTPDRHEFISSGGEVLADFPFNGISTPSGWKPSYLLHQPAVEALLRQRLEELRVDVRLVNALSPFIKNLMPPSLPLSAVMAVIKSAPATLLAQMVGAAPFAKRSTATCLTMSLTNHGW